MQRHEISIKALTEYCELCSEYHRLARCPSCSEWAISDQINGQMDTCQDCGFIFSVWSWPCFLSPAKKGESYKQKAIIAQCEHLLSNNYREAECQEALRFIASLEPDSVDDLRCNPVSCPITTKQLSF
jgi:hypothetical protein